MVHALKSLTRAAIGHLHYVAAFVLLLALSLSSHFAFGAAATVEVAALDYEFQAKIITINVGDTVSWTNKGQAPHTITASDSTWSSANLAAGQKFARTFTKAGTYAYYCKLHGTAAGAYMAGTVVVHAAPVTVPARPSKLFLPLLRRDPVVVIKQTPVDAIDFSFTPKTLVITAGESVKWTNKGDYPHTISASDGSWDSGNLSKGQAFDKLFAKPGTYAYYCKLHGTAAGAYMAGTVIVQAAGAAPIPTATAGPAPTAAPAPTQAPTAQPAPGTTTIAMVDFSFTPKNLVVNVGTTVQWSNQGQFPHTVSGSDGSWDSGELPATLTFSKIFNTPGTYAYYCKLHGGASGTGMAGTITVQAPGSGPAPTPTAAPAPTQAPPPPPPPAGTSAVTMIDFAFTPKNLVVTTGATVRWSNQGQFAHTVSDSSGAWDSGNLAAGATFSKTFSTPGTYAYYCKLHGGASGTGMAGTIIVQAPGSTPVPTPTNAPAPTQVPPPPPPPAGTSAVSVVDFSFAPQNLVIQVGQTVRFTNQGSAAHTITASNGTWDSGKLNSGAAFSKTFTAAGTYAYYCVYHGGANGTGMAGAIIVQAAGAPVPPTPTPAPSPTPVPPPPPAPAGTSSVSVVDFTYSPKSLTISAGDSVRFTNIGNSDHTVTATDNSWGSAKMASGAAFTKQFLTAGTYAYYCQLHGTSMSGTIIVQASAGGGTGGPAPTPAPTTPPAPAPIGTPLKATLTGGPNWPAAAGFVQYENKGTSQQLYLELKAGQSYQTAGVDIFVDGVKVAVAEVNNAGECKLELRTTNGQPVPAVHTGSTVVMKLSSGELLASGTF